MTCLICLRNEGVYFSNETSGWKIVLSLFSLPLQYSDCLEGNPCCSKCKLKLEIVEVITNQINVLNEKLRYLGKGVKESFIKSFDQSERQPDQSSSDLRIKILNDMDKGVVDPSKFSCLRPETEELPFEFIKINNRTEKSHPNFDQEEEIITSDPLDSTQFKEELIELDESTNFEDEEPTDSYFHDNSQYDNFHNESHHETVDEEEIEIPIPSSHSMSSMIQIKSEIGENQRIFVTLPPTPTKKKRNRTKGIITKQTCKLCPMSNSFTNLVEFENHNKSFHTASFYSKCLICNLVFLEPEQNSTQKLSAHMQSHSQKLLNKCSLCDATYSRCQDMAEHMKTHANNESYICEICTASINGRRSFQSHMRIQHGRRYYDCRKCRFMTKTFNVYKKHILTCN